MWRDDDYQGISPERLITYVSIGILTFMSLLCCICYPEIAFLACNNCCGENAEAEEGYVGGKQNESGTMELV